MKKISVLIIAILMLTACAASGDNFAPTPAPDLNASTTAGSDSMNYDIMEYEYLEAESGGDTAWDAGINETSNASSLPDISVTDPYRKLIREANLRVETLEFDESAANLEALCATFQGFVQDSSISGTSITVRGKQYRTASYTFRIPKNFYDQFLSSMGNVGNVVSKSLNSIDVTDNYYDIDSRVKILELRRDRLYKLLETETSSRAIIEFEESLSQTLYEIDRLTGTLRRYDSLVDYSTVYVYLQEVEELTEIDPFKPAPKTAGERISAAFGGSIDDISEFLVNVFVFFVGNIIYILILLAIIAIVYIGTKKFLSRPKKQKTQIENDQGGDHE